MTEEVQDFVQRCLELSPTLTWIHEPDHVSTVLGLMLAEMVPHVVAIGFLWFKVMDLLIWSITGLIWLGRMSWHQWQAWRTSHE